MQRWIVGGLVVMALIFGGGLFAYRSYQQNRPAPMWFPLPIRVDLETAERDKVISELKTKLSEKELLRQVSKDCGLVQKWDLASDEEGADELGRRLFVKAGDAGYADGQGAGDFGRRDGQEQRAGAFWRDHHALAR